MRPENKFEVYAVVFLCAAAVVGFLLVIWSLQLMLTPDGFPITEKLKVEGHKWLNGQIQLAVKNTGVRAFTLSEARVNDVVATATFYPATLNAGDTSAVTISQTFTSGVKYRFSVITTTGNKCTYVATAPTPTESSPPAWMVGVAIAITGAAAGATLLQSRRK